MASTAFTRALTAVLTTGALAGASLVGSAPAADAAVDRQAFIRKVAPAAMVSQQRVGVPASVTIAQAILETGWGRSQLTRKANNYFGIKCTAWASPTQRGCVAMSTLEFVRGKPVRRVERFRSYPSAQGSFEDHSRLLASRYRSAMAVRSNPETFAQRLQSGGYATDPRYAASLIALMRQYRLDRYDTATRTTTSAQSGVPIPAAARSWIVDRHAPAARVRLLQSALNAHGIRVAVTGRWDAATARAVRQFQTSKGLRADGVAGPKTWRLL